MRGDRSRLRRLPSSRVHARPQTDEAWTRIATLRGHRAAVSAVALLGGAAMAGPGRAGAVCVNDGASGILNNSASQLQRVDRGAGSSICDV